MDDLEDLLIGKKSCLGLGSCNNRRDLDKSLPCELDDQGDGKREICLRKRRLDDSSFGLFFQNLFGREESPFSNVTSLDLCRNRLTKLPAPFATVLPLITHLNLSGNQFTEFPACLSSLPRLELLCMSDNRLVGPVPSSLPLNTPHLTVLRLSGNRLERFPQEMERWTKLQVLVVGDTLGGNNFTELAPRGVLKYLKRLVEMDYSNNLVDTLYDDWPGHLKSLNLYSNKLVELPASIASCQELRYLNVARNRLTNLPVELVDLRALVNLDCSGNWLCILPEEITRFMQNTTLLLAGNPITNEHAGAIAAAAVEPSHRSNHVAVEYETPDQGNPVVEHAGDLFANEVALKNLPSWATVMSCKGLARKFSRSRKQKLGNAAYQHTLRELNSLSLTQSAGNVLPKLQISHRYTSPMPTPPPSTPKPLAGPPSLLELCARELIYRERTVDLQQLPRHLREYIAAGARSCAHCGMPYVREWVSDVVVKQFLGTPNVRRRVRYCGWNCWSAAQALQPTGASPSPHIIERRPILLTPTPNPLVNLAPASIVSTAEPPSVTFQQLPRSFSESNVSEICGDEYKARSSALKSEVAPIMKPKWLLYCKEVKGQAGSWQCLKRAPPSVVTNVNVLGGSSREAILSPLVDSLDSATAGYRWEYDVGDEVRRASAHTPSTKPLLLPLHSSSTSSTRSLNMNSRPNSAPVSARQ